MSETGAKHLPPNPPPRARETPSHLRRPSPGTRSRQHSSSPITCCKWKSQALSFKSSFEPLPLYIVGETSAALTEQPMQSGHLLFCLSFPTSTTRTCKTHARVHEGVRIYPFMAKPVERLSGEDKREFSYNQVAEP